ncbi:hypothetical protein [Vannielia litorea]|uniref:Nickel/cobalt transporter regulator n=1 Tax=Vannielia litorea TaxID=1217970 RepID=A0A1N6FHH5_9RHOB|nr:hypothetical protein [Vannielia litorea]SIN94731.1 hypothetical protein SAMN05444002_1676 [Vannielia litorea]
MFRLPPLTAATMALCLAVGSHVLAESKDNANPRAGARAEQAQPKATRCPPGLAKKSPPCVAPGQAKASAPRDDKARIRVGHILDGRDYTLVRSWQYGLEPAPRGSRYAVSDGMLVLIDEGTAEVLDLIRAVGQLPD